jgi:hypothetical protein
MSNRTTDCPPASPDYNAALSEHAAEIRKLGKQTVANVMEIGRRLTECKKLVGHGNWLPWLEHEFGWSDQTARNFMRIADLSKSKTVLNLGLPVSALYQLAAPSTPTEARDEIIERAQSGESIPVAETKRIIDNSKGRKRPSSKPRSANASAKTTKPPAPTEADLEAWAAGNISKDEAVRRGISIGSRDDIGATSTGEIARKDVEIEELRNAKRQLEIKIAGLESEVEEAKAAAKPAPESKSARCSICHEKKQAVQRPVFICDDCVHIHEVREATPPADDGLDIPKNLLREKQRETTQ